MISGGSGQPAYPVADVYFSKVRGMYSDPFELSLLCATEGAEIRYTLDGSLPDIDSGMIYDAPLQIEGTTIVRAAAFLPGMETSAVMTYSYIFPAQVIHQSASPAYANGTFYPSYWAGVAADYEMDPEVLAIEGAERVINALTSIPSLSVVMNDNDLFQKIMNGGGKNDNDGLESPASMEMIYPDEVMKNFQIDCGFGPRSRNLEGRAIKRGFELMFKSEFGPTKLRVPVFSDAPRNGDNALDKFDNLILRPGFCDTWSSLGYDDSQDTYTRDPMTREAYLDVTGLGTHNHFVHLYLNGLYWGLYNLTEKLNDNFLSNYLGGEEEDWLVVKSNTDSDDDGQVNSGNDSRYQQLLDLVGGDEIHGPLRSLFVDAQYQAVCNLIDPVVFAQYIMVHCYHGPGDWPDNNWYFLMRNNPPLPGFFQVWDAEKSLAQYGNDGRKHAWYTPLLTETDTRGGRAVPSRIWKAMLTNPDFRMLFSDQVYSNLMKSDGPLTNEHSLERWNSLNDYIGASDHDHAAILGESARWGDVNIDNSIDVPALYVNWISPVMEATSYLSVNDAVFYDEFSGLLSVLKAPRIRVNHAIEESSAIYLEDFYEISLENMNGSGDIYFRTDGMDPRISGGDNRGSILTGSSIYHASLGFNGTVRLRCRIYDNGSWSPLNFLDIENPNGFHVSEQSGSYELYPNPFLDHIWINFNNPDPARIIVEIYSLTGMILFSSEAIYSGDGRVKVNLEHFPSGSYLVCVRTQEHTVLERKVMIRAE